MEAPDFQSPHDAREASRTRLADAAGHAAPPSVFGESSPATRPPSREPTPAVQRGVQTAVAALAAAGGAACVVRLALHGTPLVVVTAAAGFWLALCATLARSGAVVPSATASDASPTHPPSAP